MALIAGTVSYLYIPSFFLWLTPVLLGPALSIPLSRFTSRVDVGRKLQAWGIFLTPCESDPPRVLQLLVRNMSDRTPDVVPELATSSLFEQAIAAPFLDALHRTLLERQPRAKNERLPLDGLAAGTQENGSAALTRNQTGTRAGE